MTRSSFSRRLRRRDRARRERGKLLRRRPRRDLRLRHERQQRLAEAGAVGRQDRAGARAHEADRQRRQHALEIHDLPVIEDRDLRRLARRVAQRHQVRVRRLAQVEAAGDDVAEDEALDAELIGAVLLGEKTRLLERRQQPEGGRARDAGALRQIGERQPRLAEREDAQQLQRLRGGIDGVAGGRRDGPATLHFRRRICRTFHWVKRYIAR